MTLPSSGNISTDMIMAELRISNPSRAYPLSLNDADVRSLCGVASGQVSLPGNFYGKGSGGSTLTAIGNDASASNSSITSGGTSLCSPSVSPSGGTAPYSYNWSATSNPDGCTIGGNGSSSISVSHTYAKLATGGATVTLSCIISDSASHTFTMTGVTASLSWTGNQ